MNHLSCHASRSAHMCTRIAICRPSPGLLRPQCACHSWGGLCWARAALDSARVSLVLVCERTEGCQLKSSCHGGSGASLSSPRLDDDRQSLFAHACRTHAATACVITGISEPKVQGQGKAVATSSGLTAPHKINVLKSEVVILPGLCDRPMPCSDAIYRKIRLSTLLLSLYIDLLQSCAPIIASASAQSLQYLIPNALLSVHGFLCLLLLDFLP